MENKEQIVRTLFEKMLKDGEVYAKTYKHYAKDMKDFRSKVQWKFGPIKGYQVYNETEYSFKMDAEIENPDILVTCDNLNFVKQFLKNELDDMRDFKNGDFEITAPKAVGPATSSPLIPVRALITKLPSFRPIVEKTQGTEHSTAVVIPINQSLGTLNSQAIPYAVLEYFINKAKYIFLYDICPCRVNRDCKNYDHDKYGCMVLGRGVLRMKPNIKGHRATKEEALQRARDGIAAGLLPGFGRLRSDAINRIGGPVPDTGDLFNMCYCCPCCCVVGGIKHAPSYVRSIFKRFEGLTVSVNEMLCTNCGKCAEVCIYGGRQMADGKLIIDDEKCFGCGRCETVCETGATSINLEPGSVEQMIARIEAQVDVT
jgi:UDP-glucose 4-epimerase